MKKRNIFISLLILIILITSIFFIFPKSRDPYSFKEDTLCYSQNRPSPIYEMSYNSTNDSIDLYNIKFQSKNFLQYNTTIYGLLFIPQNKTNIPSLVLLPGGGIPKENEYDLSLIIAKLGYGVLTFDQRGIGQTGGIYLDPEHDYEIFQQGKEPIQHLSVYDPLVAYDLLKQIKNIDKNNIAIAGESMGGRYAIIAAAIDKRLKGVLVISSSGFHIKGSNETYIPYLLSIDPDHYIDKISPNKVFMIHGDNDTTITLKDAQETYQIAKDPKRFYIAKGCGHGYCNSSYDELKKDLKDLFLS